VIISILEHCVETIGIWMPAGDQKLNRNKTELLWVGNETFISILISTGPTPMHLEPFVMYSALPARPQPLVKSPVEV